MATAVATLRVLVVDDEPLIRWSISETLGSRGHHVDQAADAASTLRLLATGPPPDVVLLDVRLPDSHDLTLLAGVRRLAPAAKVVMMTAFGEEDMADEARALGACCVKTKPLDMRDLDAIVRSVLSH